MKWNFLRIAGVDWNGSDPILYTGGTQQTNCYKTVSSIFSAVLEEREIPSESIAGYGLDSLYPAYDVPLLRRYQLIEYYLRAKIENCQFQI